MTAALVIGGIVFLCGLAIWWGRRDAKALGRTEASAKARGKAIEDAQESDRIRRDVKRGAGRERLRRFDRD